jgi:hypothetical protein
MATAKKFAYDSSLLPLNVDEIVKSPNRPLFVIPDERSEIRNPVISSKYGCRIKKACPGLDPGSGMTLRRLVTNPSTLNLES